MRGCIVGGRRQVENKPSSLHRKVIKHLWGKRCIHRSKEKRSKSVRF